MLFHILYPAFKSSCLQIVCCWKRRCIVISDNSMQRYTDKSNAKIHKKVTTERMKTSFSQCLMLFNLSSRNVTNALRPPPSMRQLHKNNCISDDEGNKKGNKKP